MTDQIRQYLEERGKTCLLCDNSEKGEKYHYTGSGEGSVRYRRHSWCSVVTARFCRQAGDVVDLQIPLLGINLGTLGYLAEIDRDTLYPALDHLMADEYTIEHRMMLCGSIYRDGKLIAEDAALNDITITREKPACRPVRQLRQRGVLKFPTAPMASSSATPTGSTSYSLSAAARSSHRRQSLMLMTPLAPAHPEYEAFVFPAEDVIEVELRPSRDGGIEQGMAYFDGDTAFR